MKALKVGQLNGVTFAYILLICMDTYPRRMQIVYDQTHFVRYVKFLFSNPLQIFKGRMVKKNNHHRRKSNQQNKYFCEICFQKLLDFCLIKYFLKEIQKRNLKKKRIARTFHFKRIFIFFFYTCIQHKIKKINIHQFVSS